MTKDGLRAIIWVSSMLAISVACIASKTGWPMLAIILVITFTRGSEDGE